MDRRELEIMLNDAFDRGIVTARAVEGIYPPAVTVGILDDLGREIDFGHEGSGLTVFLPGIEDDARFAGSCKALGGKVPQNTYRMELVSAIAGELMGAESATALSALESALDRARRRGYCVFDRGIHDDVPDPGLVYLLLALPQNQPNAPLYPAGGAPGSRPGALPHFGRPRYLGPPPRARSTAG